MISEGLPHGGPRHFPHGHLTVGHQPESPGGGSSRPSFTVLPWSGYCRSSWVGLAPNIIDPLPGRMMAFSLSRPSSTRRSCHPQTSTWMAHGGKHTVEGGEYSCCILTYRVVALRSHGLEPHTPLQHMYSYCLPQTLHCRVDPTRGAPLRHTLPSRRIFPRI